MDTRHLGRYIDPISDFGFKRLFGSEPNKDLLIDFLNAIFEGRKHIVNLSYNKNEYPGVVKDNRGVIFDLLCTGDEGEQFIIEVQKTKQQHFRDRSVFYTSSLICDQAVKGGPGWDYRLDEVWLIGLMDFCFDHARPDKYLHDVHLADTETRKEFYNKLGYIFIELPKFNKSEEELSTTIDKWLYVLKNMYQLEKIPVFLKKSIFEKLFKLSEMNNLPKEDYILYLRSQMHKWDYQNGLDTARIEGRAQGVQIGQDETQKRIARNLKQQGISPEAIAEATGLTIADIDQL